jgi:hypothetical protein
MVLCLLLEKSMFFFLVCLLGAIAYVLLGVVSSLFVVAESAVDGLSDPHPVSRQTCKRAATWCGIVLGFHIEVELSVLVS